MTPPTPPLDIVGGIWSGAKVGEWCGIPLVPTVTQGYGAKVIPNVRGSRVWGWAQPGDLRAVEEYGRRLILDLELRGTNKVRPEAGWTGAETMAAAVAAARVGGVTSHGYALKQLRPVLAEFAAAGAIAYPQVYDSNRSASPREFLRDCVGQYRALGFREVRPLLGLSAGADFLVVWLDECRGLGLRPDLWQLARAREMKLCASPLPKTSDSSPPPAPRPPEPRPPEPRPIPWPFPRSDSAPTDAENAGGIFLPLLVLVGLVYGLRRS